MKSKTLTHFNGCDMALISNGIVIAEIGAITWTEEDLIRGDLYFTLYNKETDLGPAEIFITFTNEYGEVTKITLERVTIIFNPDNELVTGVHSFESHGERISFIKEIIS